MASLDDILTTTKNIVVALNQIGQTYLQVEGSKSYTNITKETLVQIGQGRVARLIVVMSGSEPGGIYDSSSEADKSNRLFIIPTATGISEINIPVNNGILVVPGVGQTINIVYS